jgi:hypothetical protein
MVLRHRVVKFIRDYLDARGFLEIETPPCLKPRRKARGITWSLLASTRASSMPYRNPLSSSSSC